MKYLYVCSSNRNTSRTALDMMSEMYFKDEHDSAGISPTDVEVTRRDFWDKAKHVTEELLEWADKVFVFEPMSEIYISTLWKKRFDNKVLNLNVPPLFQYGDPKLVEALTVALKKGIEHDLKK